jgi:pyruvate/2-oxoglutarate dehydrogenase complex dihydrolipoamide dehydrogenase (E3) component
MQSEAIELIFNAKEINVSQDGNGISIKINGVDKEIKVLIYYSLGRSPNTDMLQLEIPQLILMKRDILPWMTIVKLT